MKQTLYLLGAIALFASCKGKTETASTESTKAAPALIYKATYSSSFSISDSVKYVQAVLQSYKDWEDNKMSNAAAYFADTIAWDNSSGDRHKFRRDSMVHYWQKYRDSLSSSKIEMISIVNLHSIDKKEDWVSVWYKQTDTYKSGKVDSAFYNDVNHINKGKIDYVTSLRQALKKRN